MFVSYDVDGNEVLVKDKDVKGEKHDDGNEPSSENRC